MMITIEAKNGTITNIIVSDYVYKTLIRVLCDNSLLLIDYIKEDLERYKNRGKYNTQRLFLSNYQCAKICALINKHGNIIKTSFKY